MAIATPRELREGFNDKNKLVPQLANTARRIPGIIGSTATLARAYAHSAFNVCAGYMAEARRTRRASEAVSRLARYLKGFAMAHGVRPIDRAPWGWMLPPGQTGKGALGAAGSDPWPVPDARAASRLGSPGGSTGDPAGSS